MSLILVRNLPIFTGSQKFKGLCVNLVKESYRLLDQSIKNHNLAEQTLLHALGLENWQPPEALSYTRKASDAFKAGRLDAEFFEPGFSEIEEHIKTTRQSKALGELLSKNQRGRQPSYAETGLAVINSKHVINGEVQVNHDNRYAKKRESDNPIHNEVVLINGTGVGTIGRSAPYLHTEDALPDNHVTILRPHEGSIEPIYLSIFLNSIAGQLQVKKWYRGSSGQIELYPEDIARFTVWLAPDDVQTSIKSYVENSFEAKLQATQLLEAAKHAVEIAIEQSEEAALEYLTSQEAAHP